MQRPGHETTAGVARVLIIDDHPVVRRGLKDLLQDEPDIEVCGEAGDAHTALELAESLKPDVALVDLALGLDDGIDLLTHLDRSWIGLKTIVVTARPVTGFARRALDAGADGFVSKDEAMDHILDAIRAVRGGDTFLSPRPAELLHSTSRDSS